MYPDRNLPTINNKAEHSFTCRTMSNFSLKKDAKLEKGFVAFLMQSAKKMKLASGNAGASDLSRAHQTVKNDVTDKI